MHYTMGPFAFESDFAFPELRPGEIPGALPVRIRRVASLPAAVPDGIPIDADCTASVREYLLDIPDVARFHVLSGNEVRVQPYPEAQERDLRIYLLGSVFGVLCHQNGFLPLHASAVASEGGATAFLADSGGGKSTLAAFLGRRGFPVLADDICLLRPTSGDRLTVCPVGGWLKLWKASLDVLEEPTLEEHRVVSGEEKFRVYHGAEPQGTHPKEFELRRVVFLERPLDRDSAAAPELIVLPAPLAVASLMDATYNAYLLHRLGLEQRLFRQCAQVMRTARAFRLVAPWGWERMPEVLDLLETLLGRPDPA